jgi:hypothetical protein
VVGNGLKLGVKKRNMAYRRGLNWGLAFIALTGAATAFGQTPARLQTSVVEQSRLAGDWQTSSPVVLPMSLPPLAQDATDLGIAPSQTRLERMLLLLEPSKAQADALDRKLGNQENSASADYHRWLTAGEFAAAYANSAGDVAAVVAWLQSQGFSVAAVPAGRGWIEFSGTAGEVESAFHTQLHGFATAGGTRYASTRAIAVPGALAPVVRGLVSLDGALATATLTMPQAVTTTAAALAQETDLKHAEALTPQLAAQVLHLDAVHSAGTLGAGQTIVIAARSNVNAQDVATFRSAFGLKAMAVSIDPSGPDAGLNADQAEAEFIASWAGVAAPAAKLVIVPAATTGATDGVDLALAAIVDRSLAHTVVVGFSSCEAGMSATHQAWYGTLYRQAAAEGIAVIVAAGDSGAAACHAAGTSADVSTGYSVNALAATPWNTAVGAAAFDNLGTSGLTAWSPLNAADPAYAGGGGASTVYVAPSWQPTPVETSATSEYRRLLPDLALPTGVDTGANRGLAFCFSGATSASGCTLQRSGGSAAAAAVFGGIAALLAEKDGAQGNLAPNLYALIGRSGVFTDVQQGSARLSCMAGSAGCSAGQIGYAATVGYDMASGLGSVNAEKLVNAWASSAATGTGTADVVLTFAPTQSNATYNPSAQITFTASVSAVTTGTPTGTIAFLNTTTGANLASSPTTLNSDGTATLQVTGALPTGGNDIEAVYSGDSNYAPAKSAPVVVTIEPSTTSMVVVPSTLSPAAGSTITATVTLTVGNPVAGSVAPSGKVTLNLNGLANSTATLSSTTTGSATATFSVTLPAAGAPSLQAIYAGDANYDATTSPAVTVTVSKGASVTTLTATPAVLSVGTTESFTATITPVSPVTGTTYTFTGTVSFYDGTTLLGSGVVNANTATLAGVSLSTVTTHLITAVYSGDTSWATSTSNAVSLAAVLLNDTVTLTVSPPAPGPGQVVTMVATVTPTSTPATTGEQNPTGFVYFYDGTTVLGEVMLTASLGYSSTATLLNATLPAGNDVLTAVYVGDLYYEPGTSNSININVQDFTITPSSTNPPTNLTIVQGSSGSASFVVTGLGGFNGEIQVVCAVPTQDDMTCQASPQQVTPTGAVTFTVQTFAAGQSVAQSRPGASWPRAVGGAALALLAVFLLPSGRRARRWITIVLLSAALGGIVVGCSSVSGSVATGGTPLGVATLKITGASYIDNTVVSHSVYLTVNVVAPGTATSSAQPTGNGR